MKLNYRFEFLEMDGEYMAVPIGENASDIHCMMKMNKTAVEILRLLEKGTDEQGILEYFLSNYKEDDPESIKISIDRIFEGLKENKIVE